MPRIPDTMRAVVLHEFGGPEKLEVVTAKVPDVGPDEVLVEVHTAGVGVWDPYEREGGMTDYMEREPSFPYIPGSDGAGTVAATGDDVQRFDVGDPVFVFGFLNPKGGLYAEYAALDADRVAPLPDGLDLEQAGVLAVDGITALQGLGQALAIEEGQTLLVFGASGGVGHLAVQIARRTGARVLAVASGDDGVARLWRVEEEFIGAIRGREPVRRTTFEDGVRYMEFTEAVHRAMRYDAGVALPL